jgi:hypothetical protein
VAAALGPALAKASKQAAHSLSRCTRRGLSARRFAQVLKVPPSLASATVPAALCVGHKVGWDCGISQTSLWVARWGLLCFAGVSQALSL